MDRHVAGSEKTGTELGVTVLKMKKSGELHVEIQG